MIRRTLGCGFGVVALLVAMSVGLAAQGPKTLTVPDEYPTIQAAIDAASPGDTVFIRAGAYTENLTITKPQHAESGVIFPESRWLVLGGHGGTRNL